MSLWTLARKSLLSRRSASALTLVSLALAVALLISVERLRQGAEEGFTGTISQTDLIVGARTGPLNLLLFTVFNLGSASNQIQMSSFERYSQHPMVEWTIPISLGDGHRGFRVVATTPAFFEHYRYRGDLALRMQEGTWSTGLWDVVLGAGVARQLKYKLGDSVVLAHGVTRGEGILTHDDKPFHVVGILEPTGTALDQSLYISLEGMEGIHIDWKDGAFPTKDQQISAESLKLEDLKPQFITAFFLRTKSRIETLRLQREINTDTSEPLMAIIPGVALSELWRGMGYLESSLKGISWLVVSIGLLSLVVALLSSLGARRREMAILRALGAGPRQILFLLVLEAMGLVLFGALLGYLLQLVGFEILERILRDGYGIVLSPSALSFDQLKLLAMALTLGLFAGLIPAIAAFRMSVRDGLSPRS